jgi:hypothetical protein
MQINSVILEQYQIMIISIYVLGPEILMLLEFRVWVVAQWQSTLFA